MLECSECEFFELGEKDAEGRQPFRMRCTVYTAKEDTCITKLQLVYIQEQTSIAKAWAEGQRRAWEDNRKAWEEHKDCRALAKKAGKLIDKELEEREDADFWRSDGEE